MADRLADEGFRAAAFYAAMTVRDKATVLRDWKEGRLDCVCATIAFGMVCPNAAESSRCALTG